MRRGSYNHSPEARARARELRKSMSVSEKRLWYWLREKKTGFLFKKQVPVGVYFLDFYCPEAKLCVEVDGEQHAQRQTKDKARDEYLRSVGIDTFRLPSLDLFEHTGAELVEWVTLIVRACEERAGRKGKLPF
ncbi:MAG: DUF559 domain-containing protein [Fimbriimonadaceae bacterium]|nr:DUF559 domain-containing protein [Fimbriimonadaceae bacterium]